MTHLFPLRALRPLALALLALAAPAAASAAALSLQSTFTLTRTGSGPDTPGLSGATVVLLAAFAEGTVFTRDGFATPRAVASNVTVMVSGASVAATNTTYAPTATLGLFATGNAFDGLLTSGPSTNVFVVGADATFFGIAGLVNQVRLDAGGSVGLRALGDLLTLDILRDVRLASGGVVLFSRSGQGGTSYAVSDVTTTAFAAPPAVPLPAALPLLAGALAVLAGLARRRARSAAA
ncbi:MAG: hypothetical protein ACK4TB_08250 [Gemmobacter sp.]